MRAQRKEFNAGPATGPNLSVTKEKVKEERKTSKRGKGGGNGGRDRGEENKDREVKRRGQGTNSEDVGEGGIRVHRGSRIPSYGKEEVE